MLTHQLICKTWIMFYPANNMPIFSLSYPCVFISPIDCVCVCMEKKVEVSDKCKLHITVAYSWKNSYVVCYWILRISFIPPPRAYPCSNFPIRQPHNFIFLIIEFFCSERTTLSLSLYLFGLFFYISSLHLGL